MKRYRIIGGFVVILLAVAVFGSNVYTALSGYLPYDLQSDRSLAGSVVAACSKEAEGSGRDLCYEKTIPAMMDKGISMERAYAITALVQQLDTSYRYCHVLAHNISAKETAKDPSKWKDIIARAPTGVCGNGALHGAFQERFRSESLPDASAAEIESLVSGACDPREGWNPTFIQRSSCMHGLGHLLMFITDANIPRSLKLCEVLGAGETGDEFVETCKEGIFMQLYQPLEPEDVGLVAKLSPASKHPVAFCSQFTGKWSYAACIKESWPAMDTQTLQRPKGLESVCKPLQGLEGYDNCVRGVVYAVFGLKEFDVDAMVPFCSQLSPFSIRDLCTAAIAIRLVDTDWSNIPQALAACKEAGPSAKECWSELATYAGQGLHGNSPESKALCGGMPEPWRSTCLENSRTTL